MENNKIFKIMLVLIITIVSFLNCTQSVSAEGVPSTINISSSSAVKGYIGENVNFGTKTLSDGTLAYCLDYHKQTTVNTVGTLVGEMDAGMTYLIENGYPNKSITGNNQKDYYITQVAIWWYLDSTTGSNNLDDAFKTTDDDPENLREIIKNLVNNAIAAKNKGYKNPAISASINNKLLTATNDKKYYISDEVKVNLTDLDEYTVSITNAPEGSFITDKDGNKKTTFAKNETFRIYVPGDKVTSKTSTIKLKITSSTIYNKVYEYKPPVAEEQNLAPAILYPTTKAVETSIDLSVSKSIITIKKIDASTNKPLAGAVLVIKDANGKEVVRFTTTEDDYILYDLSNGTYTVSEISAPNGYALSDKTYKFTIDDNTKEQTIKFENYPSVDVPDTNSNSSIIMYILGTLIMISGIGFVIYNAKKQTKN